MIPIMPNKSLIPTTTNMPQGNSYQMMLLFQELNKLLDAFPGLSDRYIPFERIGEGTFSVVYKAIDAQHGWHDNTIWCPDCFTEAKEAQDGYKGYKEYGIDNDMTDATSTTCDATNATTTNDATSLSSPSLVSSSFVLMDNLLSYLKNYFGMDRFDTRLTEQAQHQLLLQQMQAQQLQQTSQAQQNQLNQPNQAPQSQLSQLSQQSQSVYLTPLYKAFCRYFLTLQQSHDANGSGGTMDHPIPSNTTHPLNHWSPSVPYSHSNPPDPSSITVGPNVHGIRIPVVAIKCINVTSSPKRTKDELFFLSSLTGKPNIVPLLTALRYEDQVIAVHPYVRYDDFKRYYLVMTIPELKKYLKQLLLAIKAVHDTGFVHRDIKPSNFLYCQGSGRGWLVDFGLAQREFDPKDNNNNSHTGQTEGNDSNGTAAAAAVQIIPVYPAEMQQQQAIRPGYFAQDARQPIKACRAGTRGFRAPEVLLKHQRQSRAIDIWSAGIILLSIMTRRYPFFESNDDHDALVEIAQVVGSKTIEEQARLLGRHWIFRLPEHVPKEHIGFERLVAGLNPEMASPGFLPSEEEQGEGEQQTDDMSIGEQKEERGYPRELYDLLYGMLAVDYRHRLTVEQALEHPFLQS